MPDPAAEIESLRREIREHDRRYYVDAAPTISDREYDELLAGLRKREEENPDLVTPIADAARRWRADQGFSHRRPRPADVLDR